jgi:hypothetical protein
MTKDYHRTAVLLGAGASADAGMPLTNEFARNLVGALSSELRPERNELRALNFIYGAMVAQSTDVGGDPFAAVNVETMFSAIRLLRERNTHEASPFITGWKLPVGAFDSKSSMSLEGAVEKGVGRFFEKRPAFKARDLTAAIRSIVRDEMGGNSSGEVYSSLETMLLKQVQRSLGKPTTVEYLEPLIRLAKEQPMGLDVATLNYDLTVEAAAATQSFPVERGFTEWTSSTELSFRPIDGSLNLIKLHGSIDWEFFDESPGSDFEGGLPQRVTRAGLSGVRRGRPAIVIGTREKLGTGGPTLALLQYFSQALGRADRLVIVGYSGGDAHVNTVIRDWLNADANRTITVLDPFWSRSSGWYRNPSFPEELNAYLWMSRSKEQHQRRLHIIRDTTEGGLQRALTEMPPSDPDEWFTVKSERVDSLVLVEVANNGRALGRTRVSGRPTGLERQVEEPISTRIARSDVLKDPHMYTFYGIPFLAEGEALSIELQYPSVEDAEGWALEIHVELELGNFSVVYDDSGLVSKRDY